MKISRVQRQNDVDRSLIAQGETLNPTDFSSQLVPVITWPPQCERMRDYQFYTAAGGAGVTPVNVALPLQTDKYRYVPYFSAQVITAGAGVTQLMLEIVDPVTFQQYHLEASPRGAPVVGEVIAIKRPILVPPDLRAGAQWGLRVNSFGGPGVQVLQVWATWLEFNLADPSPYF